MDKIANFRLYQRRNQCELIFHLQLTIEQCEINEQIKAVRQITDNVGSLNQHIVNKIKKLVEMTGNEQNKNLTLPQNLLKVVLKRGEFDIKEKTILKSLFHEVNLSIQVNEKQFPIIMNAPFIEDIKLPRILYVDCEIQPIKVKAHFMDNNKSTYLWYKSTDKQEWQKIGNEFIYKIQNDDIGHYLKFVCLPKSEYNVGGNEFVVICEDKVHELPEIPECPFEKRHVLTNKKLRNKSFRLCTYNVLSERYTDNDDQFDYCDPLHLSVQYRKLLILKELQGYNADIICMQELDQRHYGQFYKQKMNEIGYASAFYKKGFRINEGLACFYNKSMFKEISRKQIVLGLEIRVKLFENLWEMIKNNETVRDSFINQSTSLLTVILKHKSSLNYLIVGNTHLYYHPDYSYVRLLQVNVIAKYLLHVKKKLISEFGKVNVSVILCGDFNSNSNSSVYKYMCERKIDPQHEDCLKIAENGNAILNHELCFQSAYDPPPLYTNYTLNFKGCLDYIFIDESLNLLQTIPLYSEEDLEQFEGCPNKVFPSDHFALVADLEFLS